MTRTKIPIASAGLPPSARRNSARSPWCSNSRGSTAMARSGTFSHPQVCHRGGFGYRQTLNIGRGRGDAHLLAIDRQTYRYGHARSKPALDLDRPAMKFDEPFHDREPESRSIVRAVVGGSRLEEGIADVA